MSVLERLLFLFPFVLLLLGIVFGAAGISTNPLRRRQ